MTPLVSIIIPAYNAGPWLRETIQSALNQTWSTKEIIVVNDGSTDDTLASAQSFQSSGLLVLTQRNRGASAARNAGLAAAQGDYIQFLDADDLLAPDKIAEQMRALGAVEPDVLSSSTWARFRRSPEEARFTPEPNWRHLTGVEFLQLHFEGGWMMQPAAWLTPRSLIDRAGGWNETLSLNDDGEFFARVMLTAKRILFVPTARSYYRSELTGSLSGRKDFRALESLYHSIELTIAHLLAADRSPRTLSAAAYAWKWTAFELHPGAPKLSRAAEAHCKKFGGSSRPFPGSGRFKLLSALLGWRAAKRLLS